MARLSLSLLGGFQARLGPDRPLKFQTKKAQALLAYLALPAGRAHPRDKLAALLWGEMNDQRSRSSLRQTLFDLRRALGTDARSVLRAEGGIVALDPAEVDLDVAAFMSLAEEGTPEALEQVAACYRGELLEGMSVGEDAFETWLMQERERLRELALQALAKLLSHQNETGDLESAVRTARQLLTLDPLQEAVHCALMRTLSRLGRRGAALRQYQYCVTALQRELGVEPGAETRQLYQEIFTGPTK
jgi:DNA-binding SARP family transcriptional activator